MSSIAFRQKMEQAARFVWREGNNLPPNVPEVNLAALYRAALEHAERGSQGSQAARSAWAANTESTSNWSR